MFGQSNPIYSQIPQASLPGVTPEMQMVAQEQAKPKGGMFGGASIDLSRAIAGYLAGMGNPAGVQALQAMNEQRQRLLEHQQSLEDYNRKRADDNTDFQTKRQFEVDHPLPTSNDTANDYAFWQQHLTPDQFTQWLQKQYDPEVSVPLPGGSMYVGPRSGMAGALGGGRPSAAPKPLTDDEIRRMQGGPASQAPGGFPGL